MASPRFVCAWRSAFFAGLLGAASPSSALAQNGTTAPPGTTELGRIAVTAQSGKPQARDEPLPITVVASQDIDAATATNLSQLDVFVPGLQVNATQPAQPVYSLRGIQTVDYGIGTDPAVGVFIDGVYQARPGGSLLALNDVDRVEVLKGQQSSLLGRSTPAGAISIATHPPSGRLEGDVRLRTGNNGQRYGDALLNLPLGRDMALRLSVLDNQSDGWVRDAANGRHYGKDGEWGARAAWRWDVSPGTQVLLTWTHDRLKQPSAVAIGLIPLSGDPRQRPPYPADPADYLDPRHAPYYNDSGDGHDKRLYNAATLRIEHDFPWGRLTSTTAWSGYGLSHIEDADGTDHTASHLDSGVIGHGRSWYQEWKLAGSGDRLDWVLGVSYYQESDRQANLIRTNTDTVDTLLADSGVPTGAPDGSLYGYADHLLQALGLPYRVLGQRIQESVDSHGLSRSGALYGEATWHLSDRLNLDTGLRYTYDRKDFGWYTPPRYAPGLDQTLDQLDRAGLLSLAAQALSSTPQRLRAATSRNLVFVDAVGQRIARRDHWSDLSPRLAFDYRLAPGTMAYAALAKGYKAGGYNSVQVGSVFAPERVWSLEAGLKSTLATGLLLDASVYAYRYDNLQAPMLTPASATGTGVPAYLIDSTDQQAKGLDLQAQWQATRNLQLALGAAYIDATYRHAASPTGADLSGQPTGEPRLSYTAAVRYAWHQVASGTLVLDLRYGYRGPVRCNGDSPYQGLCAQGARGFTVGGAQRRTDLRLDWTARNGRWGTAFYVSNLFDQRVVLGINNLAMAIGAPTAYVNAPRMLGVEWRGKL